jgi:hypothetical protein
MALTELGTSAKVARWDIGRHLAEDDIAPPLRALFIYNHNPIVVPTAAKSSCRSR